MCTQCVAPSFLKKKEKKGAGRGGDCTEPWGGKIQTCRRLLSNCCYKVSNVIIYLVLFRSTVSRPKECAQFDSVPVTVQYHPFILVFNRPNLTLQHSFFRDHSFRLSCISCVGKSISGQGPSNGQQGNFKIM